MHLSLVEDLKSSRFVYGISHRACFEVSLDYAIVASDIATMRQSLVRLHCGRGTKAGAVNF